MPRLGSFGGARGFGRFGIRAFLATGGTDTVDANGFRHHIFKSSGTLELLSGGEKEVFIISQNGGNAGTNATRSGNRGSATTNNPASAIGGTGGTGGQTQYLTGTLTSNLTITVGAAGNSSSISGINLATWKSATQATGGVGSQIRTTGNQWFPFAAATSAGNGTNYASNISSIYSGIGTNFMPAESGGGGGGGGGDVLNYPGPSGGGVTGGGGGGRTDDGTPGTINTGGGGGGGGHWLTNIFNDVPILYLGASGGSGYVVVSYAL